MKKFLLSFMLICSAILAKSQNSFINLDANVNNGGGIAAYCLSGHSLVNLQTAYLNKNLACLNGYTNAYYYIGSRDVIEPDLNNNINHFGMRGVNAQGFPNFVAALANNNFNFGDVKITFREAHLGNDIFGEDWFKLASNKEMRIYKGRANNKHFEIWLGNDLLIMGELPNLMLNIDYHNSGICNDDILYGKTNFAKAYNGVFGGIDNRPIAVQNVATALLTDIGDKGIAMVFESFDPANQNGFDTPWFINCPNFNNNPNVEQNTGNFFNASGKLILSTEPIDSNTSNPIPTPNQCTNIPFAAYSTANGQWLHINDNGNPVLSILDNTHMSSISVSYNTTNAVRSINNINYLGRDFIISSIDQPDFTRVRLYFTAQEWNNLIVANLQNNINTDLSNLYVTRNCDMLCQPNISPNSYGELVPIVETGVFNNGFYADIIINAFGHFYIHAGNTALLPAPPAAQGALLNCTIGGNSLLVTNRLDVSWTHTNPAVASLTPGALANRIRVNAIANGSTNVSYWIENVNGCKLQSIPVTYNVDAVALPDITGPNSVCPGSTIQMSNLTAGGTWSSLNNKLSVNAAGLVTGLIPSVAAPGIVKYSLTNARNCTGFVTKNITVHPRPALPSLKYALGAINPQAGAGGGNNFCLNRVFTITGTPASGVFTSSNNNVVTVGFFSGVVNTVGLGNAIITYTTNDINGCVNSKSMNGTVVACALFKGTKTNDLEQNLENNNRFSMFPNPAKNAVNIQCETVVGNVQVVITDLMGKKVKSQLLSIGNNNIDIANLTKGFYLVTVMSDTGSKTQKLVIE